MPETHRRCHTTDTRWAVRCLLIVVACAALCAVCGALCAGCGESSKTPDGVPGKEPDEIAAAGAAAHYQRGIELLDAGRYRNAIKSFRASAKLNPPEPQPYLEIGACYARLGDPRRELAAYDEALAAAPDSVAAHNARGVALLKLERVEEAVEAFERAIKRELAYGPAHVNIAIAYSTLGEHELALVSLENAEQFGAPVFDVASNRGLVLARLERYAEAADALELALRERPGYLPVRFERARALANDDQLREAILELERITTMQPAFAEAYLEKARQLAAIGEAKRSLNQYGEYLSRVPKDALAWNEMGNVHFALGQYEQAEACFRKAVRHRRGFANAYRNLAATLQRLGRPREADRMRRKAERYEPEEASD